MLPLMRYMGIDYGTKRVGIAFSDESGTLAFPETIVENDKNLLSSVTTLAKERSASTVVLGESLDLKNKPNKVMEDITVFKQALEEAGLRVVYEPERFTSAAAARLQEGGKDLDASAAALILQGYIDRIRNTHGGENIG